MTGGEPRRETGAPARRHGSSQRRLARSVVLGALAVAAAIAWLATELGMDTDELLGFAGTSLLLVGSMVVLAVGGAGLVRLIRRLTRR